MARHDCQTEAGRGGMAQTEARRVSNKRRKDPKSRTPKIFEERESERESDDRIEFRRHRIPLRGKIHFIPPVLYRWIFETKKTQHDVNRRFII